MELNPIRTGKVYDINIDQFEELDDKFGIVFNGELEIKYAGF